jgi:hypothetical protein
MRTETESKALRDVRAWKAACWDDVAGLPLEQAVAKRLHEASAMARRLGLLSAVEPVGRMARVAEDRATYQTKRR